MENIAICDIRPKVLMNSNILLILYLFNFFITAKVLKTTTKYSYLEAHK